MIYVIPTNIHGIPDAWQLRRSQIKKRFLGSAMYSDMFLIHRFFLDVYVILTTIRVISDVGI